jgi:hypothetical protein
MRLLNDCQSAEEFLTGLYAEFFGRTPDEEGFLSNMAALEGGLPAHKMVSNFLNSPEFESSIQKRAFPGIILPNLRELYPQSYRDENGAIVYLAESDDRITFMERMIKTCGYYDRFGAWSTIIDEDKKRIAQLVECCGAKSCLEVGCFNAPILSLLKDRGMKVTGIDLSHLAFVVAFPNIRRDMIWGDLLTVNLEQKFDCIVALDVLEHVSPLVLSDHILRINGALNEDGLAIINSPMFGADDIFGTVFPQYIDEWIATGDRDFFRHWPCDPQGWPIHGHMVLGSPKWWQARFAEHGLVRSKEIEISLQQIFGKYFSWAPARKSLFVLGHEKTKIDAASVVAAIKEKSW